MLTRKGLSVRDLVAIIEDVQRIYYKNTKEEIENTDGWKHTSGTQNASTWWKNGALSWHGNLQIKVTEQPIEQLKTIVCYRYVGILRSVMLVLTHYQTTNFKLFQTERVCTRKWQKLIQMGENTVGKREIARYEQFLLFPVFSKGLFPRGLKRCHCVGMG